MIEGYLLKEKLDTNGHIDVYRGICLENQNEVVVKIPHNHSPTLEDVSILQHEYYLLKQLQIPGIIHVHEMIEKDNIPILILESVKGKSLQKYLKKQPLNLEQFFKLAFQLTDIIGKLHEHNIVYKNINSKNIVVNENSIILTDFSLSSQLPVETKDYTPLYQSADILVYNAPEQTGRINRPVDYRTDFYSLGIVFFEMLTGQLPFNAEDKLELIHHIIAKPAPLVTDLNPNIPSAIADIVAKLLAKMPEERYSSITGLKTDLLECAQQWEQNGYIRNFELGKKDINDHLNISHKLYGRKQQVKQLLLAFNHVSEGSTELVLVSGYSGVGKTSLIKEVHTSIVRQKGYFLQGKFDQLQSYIPFNAIVTAFQGLVKQVLAQSEDRLEQIKKNLLIALDNLGQIVIDVIPEVELIIGKQPKLPLLNTAETQNRFNYVFQKFVQVFAQEEHPIVIFLDDLQWIDNASLKFVENILMNKDTHHLLILGAYRDNEVDSTHPLQISLRELEKTKTIIHRIILAPLELKNTHRLLIDTIGQNKKNVTKLSNIIFEKTRGNPFFINIFLKMLYEEHLLTFDYEAGQWQWNLKKIQERPVTDNVIDLLTTRIHQLAPKTQEILKLAACFGHLFDIQTLTIVSQLSLMQIAQGLWEAMQANLILHLDEAYKTTTLAKQDSIIKMMKKNKLYYRFAHDRIQQAAMQLIPKNVRIKLHLRIGRSLLQENPLEEHDKRLFEIMEHFNHSLPLIHDPEEKLKLARYNFWAGNKARISTAYQAAKEYFTAATTLLQPLDWDKNYDLIFSIYKNLAACKYLRGEFEEAEKIFALLIANSKNLLDKIEIYRLNCEMLSTLNKHAEAIALGLHALDLLNIHIARKPNKIHILKIIFKIKMKIGRRNIENIELFPIQDAQQQAAVDLITQLLNNAFIVDQNLFVFLTCVNIYLSLTYGYTQSNAMSYSVYAFAIMHALNMYQEGLEFVALNNKLKQKYGESSFEGKNQFILGSFIEPWRTDTQKCLEILSHGFQLTCNSGDLVYANYCNLLLIVTSYFSTKSISEVDRYVHDTLAFIDKSKINDFSNIVKFWAFSIDCMSSKTQFTPEVLISFEKNIIAGKSKTELCFFYIYAIKLSYFLGNFQEAIVFAQKYEEYEQYSLGMVSNVECRFYQALSIAAAYKKGLFWERRRYFATLSRLHRKLRRWANWYPPNFKHYLVLVEAQMAALQHHNTKAMHLYDYALKLAEEQNALFFQGVANECAGRFYIDQNLQKIAKFYFSESYSAFKEWGALTKCKLLTQSYPKWFSLSDAFPGMESSTQSKELSTPSLDMMAILKSAEVISSEIHLDKLRQKLLLIVLEVAGAERGVILNKKEKNWVLEADGDIEEQKIYLSEEEEVTFYSPIPFSLLNYVQRTLQPVLIQDATLSELTMADSYVQQYKPRSILMIPVLYQGQLCRVLYLENKTSSYAFTEIHLQSLQLLASQAMISLENARLYYQASHDPLTGLANRNLLDQLFQFSVSQALRQNKIVVLFFLDLDNFKTINDTLGHGVGDKLLINVTHKIRKCLREGDIAARLGGDEFAILLVNLDSLNQIKTIADRLFKYITEPVILLGHQVQIYTSMGICLYPKDAKDIQTLLKLADIALYQAKENGKNQYFFYSESLQEQYEQIHRLEAELATALERNEFELHYQPIVDTTNNEIISLEALLRWNHPTRGKIAAKDFIEILEKNPLILPISKWVIRTVCKQAKKWQQLRLLHVPIAINIAAVQFSKQSISHVISTILKQTKLAPSTIELEITESTFVERNGKVFTEIKALRDLEITLVLDDFGTGYSSFEYLKRLPVSKIKIDQSFFSKGDIALNKIIIKAITDMSHQLDMKVIAEGIENQFQLKTAIAFGIDGVQGYCYSPPLNAKDCEDWLRHSIYQDKDEAA